MDDIEVSGHLSNGHNRIAFGVLLYLSDNILNYLAVILDFRIEFGVLLYLSDHIFHLL